MNKNNIDIIIVGGGLGGLLSSVLLSEISGLQVVLLEAGNDYEDRRLLKADTRHTLEGIGGAGTLGGGKLCGRPSSSKLWSKTCRSLGQYADFLSFLDLPHSAIETLKNRNYSQLHLGRLQHKQYGSYLLNEGQMMQFVLNMRERAILAGVDLKPNSRVDEIKRNNTNYEVLVNNDWISAKKVIFATGRSGSLSLKKLLGDFPIRFNEQSPDLGIRITTPKYSTDAFIENGDDVKYKLNTKHHSVRTFCVCTGGSVTPVSFENSTYFDGHFGSTLTDSVNLGVMSREAGLVGTNAALQYCQLLSKNGLPQIPLSDLHAYINLLKKRSNMTPFNAVFDSLIYFVDELHNRGALKLNNSDSKVFFPAIDRYWPRVTTDEYF
ncbi:hypothetical protein KAT92_04190, partial [Candidatus Babeliales bacterium]|nr:hypothetical protein [Candidatus Babeliales bacterium]